MRPLRCAILALALLPFEAEASPDITWEATKRYVRALAANPGGVGYRCKGLFTVVEDGVPRSYSATFDVKPGIAKVVFFHEVLARRWSLESASAQCREDRTAAPAPSFGDSPTPKDIAPPTTSSPCWPPGPDYAWSSYCNR